MTSVGPAAGLLAGRKVTSYCACAAERRLAGANWQTDQVVVDGSLVTAQAWPDNPGLLRAFIDLLGAKIAI